MLVEQLDLSESHDLLSRWMAHYVAGLIMAAERSRSGRARDEAQRICASAIVELWSHRANLFGGRQPLGSIEPILHTLVALDPNAKQSFHFPEILGFDLPKREEQARAWFELARDLDFSARLLIDFLIRRAAADAVDQTADWIDAARNAGLVDGPDIQLRAALVARLERAKQDGVAEKRRLEDQLRRLSAFIDAANGFKELVVAEIEALQV